MFRVIKSFRTAQRLDAEHGQTEQGQDELNSRWFAVGEAYQALETEQARGETPEQAAERRSRWASENNG